jgi:NTE family protein
MMDSRGQSLPPARAMSLYARTVFRQLKQARYERTEMVAFVNELLGQLTDDVALGPMAGLADIETALPNPEAFFDVLDFELRRAGGEVTTLLLTCEVDLPESCPDDTASSIHRSVARQIRRSVRPFDIVARLGVERYAVALAGAKLESASAIAARILGPVVHPSRLEDRFPDGTRVTVRIVEARPDETARGVLSRCELQEPSEISLTNSVGSVVPLRTLPPPASLSARSAAKRENVVLALGGGAARAAAHVGVLRVFDASGLAVAGAAGTSAGALVAAMALSGVKHEAILDRFVSFTRSTIYREMRLRYVKYRRRSSVPRASVAYFRESGVAFLSNEQLAAFDDEMLEDFVEFFVGTDRAIASLRGPFAVAATDLVSGRAVHILHGPLHSALRASCALPGLFPPQRDGDRMLVDGSMVAEVPVRAAVALRCDAPVVAVHLARPDRKVGTFSTSSEVVLRSASIVHTELVREQLRHAHTLVTAHVEEVGWLDFRRAEQAAALGEAAARRHIEHVERSSIVPPR